MVKSQIHVVHAKGQCACVPTPAQESIVTGQSRFKYIRWTEGRMCEPVGVHHPISNHTLQTVLNRTILCMVVYRACQRMVLGTSGWKNPIAQLNTALN